jgi:hypothetical protein
MKSKMQDYSFFFSVNAFTPNYLTYAYNALKLTNNRIKSLIIIKAEKIYIIFLAFS